MSYSNTGNPIGVDPTTGQPLNPTTITSFLNSLPTQVTTYGPGSNVSIDENGRGTYVVGANSTIDLSSSHRAPTPHHPNGSNIGLDIVVGGGANKLTLNKGASLVFSTTGNDTIKSSGGKDTIYSGLGHDSLVGGGRSVLVGGYGGNDTLVGGLKSGAHDTISSNGSAHIKTSLGHNLIVGGTGDTINAGAAADTIYAGQGASTIQGGQGSTIYGSGSSSIVGGGNNNTVVLTGHDTLKGGAGTNSVYVTPKSTVDIQGGDGHLDVTLQGKHGNDTLFGGSGGLTVHVSAAAGKIVSDNTVDQNGYTVVKFASGETLHVSNVTVDFGHNQHKNF